MAHLHILVSTYAKDIMDSKATSRGRLFSHRRLVTVMLVMLVMSRLASCVPSESSALPAPMPAAQLLAEELVFFDWAEDMPQSVLDAFSQEYGVKVTYHTFDAMKEAETKLKSGEVYDVVVLDGGPVARLAADGLLAEISYANVPNFSHIAPNFKNLVYDPGNKHSIPFNWGTTGLVVRRDLVEEMPTHWADLWDPRYAGKVGLRESAPFDMIGMTLTTLGHSINSEDPDELAAALERLLELKPNAEMVSGYADEAIPLLLNGEIAIMVGWADDVLEGQRESEEIVYVLPEEGALLWGDNFVIPANSPHKYTAEVFLNFLLRPEISAQIINENHYAMANEAAYPFIDPEIRDNQVIYPLQENLVNGEVFLPLHPEGYELWHNVWEAYISM